MVRGPVALLFLLLNTLFWATVILLFGLVKSLLRGRPRRAMVLLLARFGDCWTAGNDFVFDLFLPVTWDVEGVGDLDPDGHYLIVSNHLSWVDIPVLFRVFHRRTAFIRFFLKQSLFWIPLVGQACAAVEMVFMKRYSQEYLAKHPEKRGTDLEATRRACERYRQIPVAILIFLEGTRFTPEKHQGQHSQFRHLLRPRIGGISYVVATMGDQLSDILDVTIAYPGIGEITFWKFVSGQVKRVVVRVRRLDVPREVFSPLVSDRGPARDRFKEEVRRMWSEKDALLDTLASE